MKESGRRQPGFKEEGKRRKERKNGGSLAGADSNMDMCGGKSTILFTAGEITLSPYAERKKGERKGVKEDRRGFNCKGS